jgi:CBS domain-containing protein
MNVAALMNRTVETCHPDDNLSIAAEKMWKRDVGCLPVVTGMGRVVGMVTDRDICMASYLQGRSLSEIPVAAAMSKDVHTCRSDDGLIEAEETMRQRQVRRLPVLDASGSLEGIISLNDLAREAEREMGRKRRQVSPQEVSVTLAAVCAPRGTRDLMVTAQP